uniref:Cycloartenol synthase n=1 Tax=Arundo donax TaxID=35708 RepID=A0A0A9CXY0_ARUDO
MMAIGHANSVGLCSSCLSWYLLYMSLDQSIPSFRKNIDMRYVAIYTTIRMKMVAGAQVSWDQAPCSAHA